MLQAAIGSVQDFFDWIEIAWGSSTPEQQIRGVIELIFAGFFAWIAWRGIKTWRAQLHGSLEAERSLAFLDAIYGFATAILNYGTIIQEFELRTRIPAEKQQKHADWWKKKRNEEFMLVKSAQSEFTHEWGRVQALWGPNVFGSDVKELSLISSEAMAHFSKVLNECEKYRYGVGSDALEEWWGKVQAVSGRVRTQFADVLPKTRVKF